MLDTLPERLVLARASSRCCSPTRSNAETGTTGDDKELPNDDAALVEVLTKRCLSDGHQYRHPHGAYLQLLCPHNRGTTASNPVTMLLSLRFKISKLTLMVLSITPLKRAVVSTPLNL